MKVTEKKRKKTKSKERQPGCNIIFHLLQFMSYLEDT
jgi:hypothetical protein